MITLLSGFHSNANDFLSPVGRKAEQEVMHVHLVISSCDVICNNSPYLWRLMNKSLPQTIKRSPIKDC